MNEFTDIVVALEKRISETDSTYEWDDLMSIRCKDRRAEAIRQMCWLVMDAFPGSRPQDYCSEEGRAVLKAILEALRACGCGKADEAREA